MPERTCVCCRKKNEKGEFFRLSKVEDSYVLDKEMKIQNRGFYVCKNQDCIEKLSKHKKYNIDMEYVAEPGRFEVYIGGSSDAEQKAEFRLV